MHEVQREHYFLHHINSRQNDRYLNCRAAKIPNQKVENIVKQILGPEATVDKKIATLISGLAKVYAGELVEDAKLIQQEEKCEGPIKPQHLMEARRKAIKKGMLSAHKRKTLFKKR